jgi:hypothetical protein
MDGECSRHFPILEHTQLGSNLGDPKFHAFLGVWPSNQDENATAELSLSCMQSLVTRIGMHTRLPPCMKQPDPKGTTPVHPRGVCIDEPIPSNYWIQYDRMKNDEKRLPGRFSWAPQHWALAVSVDAVPLRIMTSVPMPLCKITHFYPSSVPNSLTYGYIWGIILWRRWFSITSTMAVLGQPHPRSSEIDCNFFEAWLKVANQLDRPIQQKILRLWYE